MMADTKEYTKDQFFFTSGVYAARRRSCKVLSKAFPQELLGPSLHEF